MWKLCIEFEILMGRFAQAKQLCYRAVTAVGGCKGQCSQLKLTHRR
jgi:hypothetical protein